MTTLVSLQVKENIDIFTVKSEDTALMSRTLYFIDIYIIDRRYYMAA